MKRVIILFLILFLVSLPTIAKEPFKLSVNETYTIDSLRKDAFKDIKKTIDVSMYEPIDPDLIENKNAIRQQKSVVKNRLITFGSVKNYNIKLLEDFLLDKTFTYSSSGKLLAVIVDFYSKRVGINDLISQSNSNYPITSYEYNYPKGTLDSVIIQITPNKEYIFNSDGTLFAYRIGDTCYDANDKVIGTAKTFLY